MYLLTAFSHGWSLPVPPMQYCWSEQQYAPPAERPRRPCACQNNEISGEDVSGALALRTPWPGMARTIYGSHQRYVDTYLKPMPGYYCTGDGAHRFGRPAGVLSRCPTPEMGCRLSASGLPCVCCVLCSGGRCPACCRPPCSLADGTSRQPCSVTLIVTAQSDRFACPLPAAI